jgi:hypothetical protein
MYSHSSNTPYDHTEPQRANDKETPKSKEASKEMHRERKECTTKKLRPSKLFGEIDNIFQKSKTNRHKWTHHGRIGVYEGLEPLPYFFIKWCLKYC